jgi:hypothetical protein
MNCQFHALVQAKTSCEVCTRELCSNCTTHFKGKVFCPLCYKVEVKGDKTDGLLNLLIVISLGVVGWYIIRYVLTSYMEKRLAIEFIINPEKYKEAKSFAGIVGAIFFMGVYLGWNKAQDYMYLRAFSPYPISTIC